MVQCLPIKNQHENQVSIDEMRMLRWMSGKIRRDKIRNDIIRERDRERERERERECG